MSRDRKRIYGPENTILPIESKDFKNKKIIKRKNDEHRPLFVGLHLVSGSFIELGDAIKITAKVFRRQHQTTSVFVDFKFAPFSKKSRRGYAKDNTERDFCLLIQQALLPAIRLELLPKTRLDIHILCLESDGLYGCLAQAINCASLALIEAGIEMLDIVSACSVGFLSLKNNQLVLDMDGEQEEQSKGSLLIATMASLGQITHVLQIGESDMAGFKKRIATSNHKNSRFMTTIKNQLERLCHNKKQDLDSFFFVDSHSKRKSLEEYKTDINLQLNLMKLEESRIQNKALAFHSSKYFIKLSEIISLLTVDQDQNEASIQAVWIILCRLAGSLEENLEIFREANEKGNSFARYLKKPDPISPLVFQQDLDNRVNSNHFNARNNNFSSLFINPNKISKENYVNQSFESLSFSLLEGDSQLSLPDLSLTKPPSIIPSKHNDTYTHKLQHPTPQNGNVETGDEFSEEETVCSDLWIQAASTNQLFDDLEPLKSWDQSLHSKSGTVNYNLISEAKGDQYLDVFDSFIGQPLLLASEMPLVEEDELVKRLLFACSGIESDLILYNGKEYQFTVEYLRTSSIGPKALEKIAKPFIAIGSKLKSLKSQVTELNRNVGLTTTAFAENITTFLLIVESNLYEIRKQHELQELSILYAAEVVSPILYILSQLEGLIFRAISESKSVQHIGILLLKYFYSAIVEEEYDLQIDKHVRYLSAITWILKKSIIPFFNWVAAWLMIPSPAYEKLYTTSVISFDPYQEFFIHCIDDFFKFDSQFSFPGFLNKDFAYKIYENGLWWRRLKEYRANDSLVSMNETTTSIELLWPLGISDLKNFQARIDDYCTARLNEWNNMVTLKKLQHLAELEEQHHEHIFSIQATKKSKELANRMIEELNEEMKRKKATVKKSIEIFLAERKAHQKKMAEKFAEEERRTLDASNKDELERQRLYQEEVQALTNSYTKAFKLLERKEASLEWRRRRVQLDALRRKWFESFVWEELPPSLAAAGQNEDVVGHILDSIIETPPQSKNELDELDEDDNLSFHSAADQVLNENELEHLEFFEPSDIPSTFNQNNLAFSDEKVELSAETFDVTEELRETSEMIENIESQPVFNQDYQDNYTSSDGKNDNFLFKGKKDVNWLLYPGTEKECFGVSNDVEKSLKRLNTAFEEILAISNQIMVLDDQLIPFKLTYQDSTLNLWNRTIQMISFASLSSFFSYLGSKDVNDIRFHLKSLHSYFFFGSPDFCMLVRDRLFKDSGDFGLNLNGSFSDVATGKIDKFVADIIPKVQERNVNEFGSKCFITFDLTGIKIGREICTNIQLKYQPPAPFDIILSETVLSRYENIFSYLLIIVQAQEALERIHQTNAWRNEKSIKRENPESCIITQFIQLSHIFLYGLEEFVFHCVIEKSWNEFLVKLDQLSEDCSLMSLNSSTDLFNVSSLSNLHDSFLDQISWSLFLQVDNQRIVSDQIKRLLALIISFSKTIQQVSTSKSVPQLYFSFHSTYQSLTRLLREIVSKEEFEGANFPKFDFKIFQQFLLYIS